MLRHPPLVGCLLVILLSPVFVSAADDVQVIRSPKSVLSIYSYGGTSRTRITPDIAERRQLRRALTGSLTDVVTTPPLATSLSVSTPITEPAPLIESVTRATTSITGTSSSYLMESEEPPMPLSQQGHPITLLWNASPDQSVVGYRLYIGDSSRHYTAKQDVGSSTIAQLVVDEAALYVTVSAYTADGFESSLSEELVILRTTEEAAATSTVSNNLE